MNQFLKLNLLSLVVSMFLSVPALAQVCKGYEALRGKDIILKPGETQTFIYDFTDSSCTTNVSGFWAYMGKPYSADLQGCSAINPVQFKGSMELKDLTSGVVGMKVSSSSVILNDPTPMADGSYIWGGYNVKGHIVELKITLSAKASRCAMANLRYAYAMW